MIDMQKRHREAIDQQHPPANLWSLNAPCSRKFHILFTFILNYVHFENINNSHLRRSKEEAIFIPTECNTAISRQEPTLTVTQHSYVCVSSRRTLSRLVMSCGLGSTGIQVDVHHSRYIVVTLGYWPHGLWLSTQTPRAIQCGNPLIVKKRPALLRAVRAYISMYILSRSMSSWRQGDDLTL